MAPGLVDTASNVEAMKPKDLKKWAKRQDIAQAVIFLASDAAAGITGQVIAVTGGGVLVPASLWVAKIERGR